jgi:Putative peptidoglycan binding domain
MSEALARVRNDSVLVQPAKASGAGRGNVLRLLGRALTLPARLYAGAAFAALLAGIGVNALLLQHERRHAPFFARTVPHPAPFRTPVSADGNSAGSTSSNAPSPPQRAAARGDAPALNAADPIGELLLGGSELRADPSRMVAEAQGALAKLGYPVKADGLEGAATEQALRDFERAHGLPVSAKLTPRLVKQLLAAARAARR